jgi:hypothetical protein
MALPFLSTYRGGGIRGKTCDSCYLAIKINHLKSFDMQTIYAIPGEFSKVMTMAIA